MKPMDYRRVDTSKPPTEWDIAWGALHMPDGALLIDNQALTVKPGTWPAIPEGFQSPDKSTRLSGKGD